MWIMRCGQVIIYLENGTSLYKKEAYSVKFEKIELNDFLSLLSFIP